jgi:hypothetical protein
MQVWKLPDGPLVVHASEGSFDCVGLRFANANFAQDDKLTELAFPHRD